MIKKLIKLLFFVIAFIGVSVTIPHDLVDAGTLTTAKDTMDISRSSWSTTLAVGASASSTTFSLTSVAGILPGDSVKLWGGTAETLLVNTVDSANNRITTTSASANAHALSTDVTGGFGYDPAVDVGGSIAYHVITFLPASTINGGEIRITFPTGGSAALANDGQPDSAGFDFNNIGGAGGTAPGMNIYCTGGGADANWDTAGKAATPAATTSDIVIPFRGTLTNALVTCNIGPTVRATGVHLINPSKTAASGTADTWSISIDTRAFPGYAEVDSTTLKIATVESVRVTATVSPTLSLIIAGTANGNSVCGETTNSGTASTAVLVPLGTLDSSALNVNAQSVSVGTNAITGYTLVIKDDGYLRSGANNFAYNNGVLTNNDAPVPAVHNTAGTAIYGVSACGTHVNTTTWGVGTGPTVNKYGGTGSGTAWQYYRTLASATAAVNSTITKVLFKATVAALTPPGDYAHVVTYVATGNF